jgi:ankyrin repeat protein
VIGNTFLKKVKREQDEPLASSTVQDSHDVRRIYHPHTIVFDSPGCKDMLSQMADKLDVRLQDDCIDLQQLDITSYLSAPNLINTCNSHLGRVYRIFTDLSDMDWTEKHTPLYNLATHSMDKIKQALKPETERVYKDDKVELKIREVVDWPVSAGLTGGAELNDFFKWAEHLNNYHPEEMDIAHSKVPKGYHPLRYQTKAYDDCTKSLSAFTQDEREFLERYRWIRHVPEFFKPEHVFCVLSNAEAEKEAERKLQNFELSNERIRCPDASTLHGLIPFVKRLVRHFPHVKEKVKDQLTSAQIRNRVYQYETQRYVEKIRQSALDFNPCTLGLREFLDSDQQIWQLRMTDGDAWTGITKVYRVLQNTSCTSNYYSDGNYTILKLKRLLTVNRMIKLNALLASTENPHLLMIACGTDQPVNDELIDMFKEMLSILKKMKNMKIILTTQSEGDIADFIRQVTAETLGECFITTDGRITWSDLTDSSKRKMLEKTVIFQGIRIALNQLTSVESITDSFPITDLLQEKELTIGEELVPSLSSGYNEMYYIDRTFNHHSVIRQDILSDERDEKFADFLASTEWEFKKLCQQNTDKNVHWLVKEKSGTIVWQQSQGNLQALRKYIDTRKPKSYAPKDLDNLLEKAKQQRVMLIADKAGMGKTSVLTRLSKRIKQKFPAHWLVRIDINDYTELLEAQKGKKMDKAKILEFLSDEVLKLESHLEKQLFKKCFEGTGINKLVVMVDGFDEISPRYEETVLDMLKVLKQTSLEQLWVTTRPHLREELEENLQQLSYTLQPFSEDEQVEFLKKFWFQISNLEDKYQRRLEICAKALIRNLSQSISDKEKEFTGIPLQTRMLAEAFEEEFRSFYESEKSKPEILHKLDLMELYGRFIDRKYSIYYKEKAKVEPFNMATMEQGERDFKNIQLEHQLLALKVWFTEDQMTFLQSYNHSTFSDEELARIGIAQRNREGRPHFIHRTFTEYFVADFLINQLTKETKTDERLHRLLLNEVLLNMDCHVIRAFLDGLLGKSQPSKETLKYYGEKLDEVWNKRKVHGILSAVHKALVEDNARIIAIFLDSLKTGGYSNTMKKILLSKFPGGDNALHVAAESNSVQALNVIREWAEAVTPTVTYSLLHSQDKDSDTTSQHVAEGGHRKVVNILWSWADKLRMNPVNLHKKLLFALNLNGRTAWFVGAESGSVEILDKLWGWAKEAQIKHSVLKNEILLSNDSKGINFWHMAARNDRVEILDKLLGWAKELKLQPCELSNEIFLPRGVHGRSVWIDAVQYRQVEVLEKLLGWAKELELKPGELINVVLFSKDKYNNTSWHTAAARGDVEVLEKLWGFVKELQLNPGELSKEVLLAKNEDGRTAWKLAAERGQVEVLEKLWGWAKEEKVNSDNLKDVLFQVPGHWNGRSTWGFAVECGRLDTIQKILGWAKELQLSTDELKNKLLLALNWKYPQFVTKIGQFEGYKSYKEEINIDSRKTAVLETLWGLSKETQLNTEEVFTFLSGLLCYAAVNGDTATLDRLWLWAGEEQLTAQELKSSLFLHQHYGQNVWHLAAEKGHVKVLEILWGWAEEVQINRETLKDKLFLEKHQDVRLPCHTAVKEENLVLSDVSLGLSEEVQTNADDIRTAMLLARDREGKTSWQLAVINKMTMVLDKLLDWAKEMQLNTDELRNELDQEEEGRTTWLAAAYRGNVRLLQELWDLARRKGNTKEIMSKLLLARNEDGETALHIAAAARSEVTLQKILAFAKETELNVESVKKKLLLAKDKSGDTAWHKATAEINLVALEILWSWAKETGTNLNELLLTQNDNGETAFHMAVDANYVDILEKMCYWAEEAQLNSDELKNELLLAEDKYGWSPWHTAAARGNLEALELLWCLAKEAELNPDELLRVQDKKRGTALHLAAANSRVGILETLLIWAEEAQPNSKEFKSKLLLAKDKDGYSAWHKAAESGNLVSLEILWSWAKEAELKPGKLLLAQNNRGKTALYVAAQENHVNILQKLWVWAEEAQLNPSDIEKSLFLAKDNYGNITWQRAERFDHLMAFSRGSESKKKKTL